MTLDTITARFYPTKDRMQTDMTLDDYQLQRPESAVDWDAYHRIRRTVLFEARGRFDVYNPHHPDEFLPENRPLLLKFHHDATGTVRLDFPPGQVAIVRLAAIAPEKQLRGHGRALLVLVENYAVTLGTKALEIYSANDAIAFYEKVGFSLVRGGDDISLLRKPVS